MMKKNRKLLALSLPIFLLAGVTGCLLVSGQITIVQPFQDDTGVADVNVYPLFVDLTENEDYEKHQDKIKSLEAFGFVVTVWNLGNMAAQGEGYLATEQLLPVPTSRDALVGDTTVTRVLFVDEPIAPGDSLAITFEMSQDYIENFDVIEDAIKDGQIYFYGVTDIGQHVKYSGLKLVATINFGL